MTRASKTWLVAVAVLLLVTGCQSLTGESFRQNLDDNGITASVKAKLVADKAVNFTRVHVTTDRGVVYLTGIVDSGAQKARVEHIASGVKGVKGVVDNLQVARK